MAAITVHDPVCHMDIEPASAAGTSEFDGATYYFCSVGCKKDFDADPRGVLTAEAEHDHSRSMDHAMTGASGKKRPFWRFWRR